MPSRENKTVGCIHFCTCMILQHLHIEGVAFALIVPVSCCTEAPEAVVPATPEEQNYNKIF